MVLLYLLLTLLHPISSHTTPALSAVKIQYVVSTKFYDVASSPSNFFTRSLGHDFDAKVTVGGKNSSAAETDDTPLELLPLGFPFYYYGTRTTSVWVNPNGGLQFIPNPPCGCCFSSMMYTGYCNFNSSYYDMLALSVTDLAPIDGPTCQVKYSAGLSTDASNPVFGLVFVDVPLFGTEPKPGPTWTFGATLSKSGKIETSYMKIFDTANPPGSPKPLLPSHVASNWLVGLRSPKAYNEAVYAVDPTLLFPRQAEWKTSRLGSYPTRTDVRTGAKMTYCPVPTSVCVEPSRSMQSSGTETTLSLTGNSPFGCHDDLLMKCRFHLPSNVGGIVDTDAIVDSSDSLSRTLQCKTPLSMAMTSSSSAAVGRVELEIVYLSEGGSHDDTPTPFSNIKYDTMATSNKLQVEFIQSSSSASLTTCDDSTSSSTDTCDVCGTCGGAAACVSGTCGNSYESQVDCAGVCNGPGLLATDGKCCKSPTLLDCNGICNGTNVEAWVQFPTILAKGCCAKNRVDCTGLCNGGAVVDKCGVCTGGTTGKIAGADMDCLGLCPNDPLRPKNGEKISCDPTVEIGTEGGGGRDGGGSSGGTSGSGTSGGATGGGATGGGATGGKTPASGSQGGGSGSGSSSSSGGYVPMAHNGGPLKWEIDTSMASSKIVPAPVRTWVVTVKNSGPIRLLLTNLAVTNSPATQVTHPIVRLEHDAVSSKNSEKGSVNEKNTWIVGAGVTVKLNITVDMRPALVEPIFEAPRRPKSVHFQYTYGGPNAKLFPVIIPIQVSFFLFFLLFLLFLVLLLVPISSLY